VHELSIAYAAVRTIDDLVGGQPVVAVRLRVGVLAGVVPDSLQFGWDVATAGTPLAGSVLTIDRVPLPSTCLDCGHRAVTEHPPPLSCSACGGRALPTAPGRELEIASVEIQDRPEEGEPQ